MSRSLEPKETENCVKNGPTKYLRNNQVVYEKNHFGNELRSAGEHRASIIEKKTNAKQQETL